MYHTIGLCQSNPDTDMCWRNVGNLSMRTLMATIRVGEVRLECYVVDLNTPSGTCFVSVDICPINVNLHECSYAPFRKSGNVWAFDLWRNYHSHHARRLRVTTFAFSKEMHFVWAMIWVHNPGLEFVLFVFHVAFG